MRQFVNPMTILLLGFMAFSSFRNGSFDNPTQWLLQELYILPGIIIGLSFHEFAHAFMAYKLGDDTPRLQGRVTINPIAHVDPIGFIALLFVGFGWGKPVEINPRNFKNPRRDELLVAVVGVIMNLLLAVVFAVALRIFLSTVGSSYMLTGMEETIYYMIYYGIYINLVLMVFNLMPIPPLDGFNVLTEIFNLKKYSWWYEIYDKGFIILMILILFNFTGRIMSPAVNFFLNIINAIVF